MVKSRQEDFWEGAFGDAYTERNRVDPSARAPFFQRVLDRCGELGSAVEMGANRGHNLQALAGLRPGLRLTGVEPNAAACEAMRRLAGVEVVPASLQTLGTGRAWDLVVCCGVLIHVNPDDLPACYDTVAAAARRFVLINEYFNPVPAEIPYRGHQGFLFKRDFGGEFWDRAGARVRLVDYGFLWKRVEPAWDDTTWWLFEKTAP